MQAILTDAYFHHVSLTTQNLERAEAFYINVLGFTKITRPSFPLGGTWLNAGTVELHLIDFPEGSFRNTKSVSTDDVHFALRLKDFDALIEKLKQHGYREDLAEADNKRVIIKPMSKVGYSQLYILDPDCHLIELNAAF